MSCSSVSAVKGVFVHGTACCQADLAQVMNGQSLECGAFIAFNHLSRSEAYGFFAIYICTYVQKYLIDIYIINIVIILINCLHCHNNWQLQPLTKVTGKSPIRTSVFKAFTD